MTIKPAIRTLKEIESLVSGVGGTWVRRRNAKNLMVEWSNEIVMLQIDLLKKEIRQLKASGASEWDLSLPYAEVTKLELRLI